MRVGVVLNALRVPAWQAAALKNIAEGDYAELVLLVLIETNDVTKGRRERAHPFELGPSQSPMRSPVARLVNYLESKFESEHDAFAGTDLASLLGDTPSVYVCSSDCSTPEWAQLAGAQIDVFVDFEGSEFAPGLARVAQRGVWKLGHPYITGNNPTTAAFWPVYHGWGVSEARLDELSPQGGTTTIAKAFPATNPFSVRLNGGTLHWRMSALLPMKLRELRHLPMSYGGATSETDRDPLRESSCAAPCGRPTTRQLAIYAARNVQRRARASWSRRLMLDQWILLVHFGADLSTSPRDFKTVIPPKDRFWADPHVVARNGRFYIFLEELVFATGKGHIAVLSINPDGTYEKPLKVLERDYHLSYPFTFEHDGTLFMVPESEANRTIDLYRCVSFPETWEFVATLISDITATDSTLIRYEDKWWLFTNVITNPGESFSEELFLFHSDCLSGKWTAHARNPVVSDSRRARPAGAILERDGRLYRPGQDCSVRYGYGIRIHEITCLSETEYTESEVGSIMPTWDPKIIATHTLSYTPGLTVLDALRPRLRF